MCDGLQEILQRERQKDYFISLESFLKNERQKFLIYPSEENIYRAFSLCPLNEVKVVILGQDPYHGEGQADGLAFSVQKGIKLPPSLKNIYKEIEREYSARLPDYSILEGWARQGVLLLNTTLSVRKAQAASHRNRGWEVLTDAIIRQLDNSDSPKIFLLWGNHAHKKQALINNHPVLTAPHPSPLSFYRGFLGCGHFRAANEFLREKGVEEIKWI